jgi:hypothetical protein
MEINSSNKLDRSFITYLFKHSIERVWMVIKDVSKCQHLTLDIKGRLRMTKGLNTYEEGSEWEVYWIGNALIHFKCLKVEEQEQFKLIEWECTLDPYSNTYLTNIKLYQNTMDQSTLATWEVSNLNQKFPMTFEANLLRKSAMNELFRVYDKYLNLNCEKISQIETILIKINPTELFDIVSDLRKFSKISPLVADEVEISDNDPRKIGTIITTKFNKQSQMTYMLRILEVSEDNENNIFFIKMECFDGRPKVPLQDIIFKVISIKDAESSFLQWEHHFREPLQMELLLVLSYYKNNILSALKNSLEKENVENVG